MTESERLDEMMQYYPKIGRLYWEGVITANEGFRLVWLSKTHFGKSK